MGCRVRSALLSPPPAARSFPAAVAAPPGSPSPAKTGHVVIVGVAERDEGDPSPSVLDRNDLGRDGHELVLPWHVVDVDLHDPEVRDRRTAVRDREEARRAGAHELICALDDGYRTRMGPHFLGGSDLSIGQWQRIALARAFFRDAPFVILDEPTAAVDPRAEAALFADIRALCHARSVLLISHRLSSVRSADRIYVLHDGRVVEHGDHQELMAFGGHYADLFTLQAAKYTDGLVGSELPS